MSAAVSQDPIGNSNAWQYARIGGLVTPGTIPRDGIKGFKRETGWDIKKGKGTAGATLTRKDRPPVEGSITLQLISSADFAAWYAFVQAVLSIPAAQQETSGLAFFYAGMPNTSDAVTAIVVKDYTLIPEHVGKGMYHVTVMLLEWAAPPATSIVSTIATTAPDKTSPDPILQSQQQEAAGLQAQIAQQRIANQQTGVPQ